MLVTNFLCSIRTVGLTNKSVTKKPLESRETNNQRHYHYQSDEEVFTAFIKGDTAALGTIYDRYGLLVYRSIYRMLNNYQEAEDITQEVFLNLQTNPRFDPHRGSFYTYLMVLTRSRAIDRLRSKRSQKRFWQHLLESKDSQERQSSLTPMDIVSFKERKIKIQNALKSLSAAQRQVLELSYFAGLSQSKIAKRLDIPLGTVKTHSRRGLLQLRKHLHDRHLI